MPMEFMNKFEAVLLLSPEITTKVRNNLCKNFTKLISDNSGKVINDEDWGLRDLSYKIGNFSKAFYDFFQIEIEGKKIENIKKYLSQNENYIRHIFIKVNDHQDFTYRSNSDGVDAVDGETIAGRYGLLQPSYYSGVQKTNSNMTIGLPIDSWVDFNIQYGDELAVFDTEGNLVGVSVLEDGNNGVVVWADDESSKEKDGMLSGEEFVFQLWQESSNTLFDIEIDWKEGLDYYHTNGINIASIITVQQKADNYFEYISCYPNPNAGEFSLEFSLYADDYISISIFNSIGEKVYALNHQIMDKGVHNLPFSLSHLTQGLYYIELRSTNDYKNIMIDITK